MAANSGTVVLLITADRIGDQLVDNWSLAAVMSNILCTFAANFLKMKAEIKESVHGIVK
jgi:hypothetical protein